MEESPAHALEVSPGVALQFMLERGNENGNGKGGGASFCTMTLKHTSKTERHIAFKVKTTQPRRYLVRPNQGVVAPGQSETVTIILVEKDKHTLLNTFDRLGQSALDHSKDKFLVQSCIVADDFASKYIASKAQISDENSSKEASKAGNSLAEDLTRMWNSAAGSGEVEIFNKKLQVRHKVDQTESAASTSKSEIPRRLPGAQPQNMTPEQMYAEISSLRRKYDELVTFSVNLTAERDILNNTLEQTKRDLNRETNARASLENRAGTSAGTEQGTKQKSGGGGISFFFVLLLIIIFFFTGAKLAKSGVLDSLDDIPVLGDFMRIDLGALPFPFPEL